MRQMVRKAFSLVCSMAALGGILMAQMPASVRILLAIVVVSFMVFTLTADSGKKGKKQPPVAS